MVMSSTSKYPTDAYLLVDFTSDDKLHCRRTDASAVDAEVVVGVKHGLVVNAEKDIADKQKSRRLGSASWHNSRDRNTFDTSARSDLEAKGLTVVLRQMHLSDIKRGHFPAILFDGLQGANVNETLIVSAKQQSFKPHQSPRQQQQASEHRRWSG